MTIEIEVDGLKCKAETDYDKISGFYTMTKRRLKDFEPRPGR